MFIGCCAATGIHSMMASRGATEARVAFGRPRARPGRTWLDFSRAFLQISAVFCWECLAALGAWVDAPALLLRQPEG